MHKKKKSAKKIVHSAQNSAQKKSARKIVQKFIHDKKIVPKKNSRKK